METRLLELQIHLFGQRFNIFSMLLISFLVERCAVMILFLINAEFGGKFCNPFLSETIRFILFLLCCRSCASLPIRASQ